MIRTIAHCCGDVRLRGDGALADDHVSYFPVKRGSGPHDVAVGADGKVWYTRPGQRLSRAGRSQDRQGREHPDRLGLLAARRDRRRPTARPGSPTADLNANVRYDPKTKKFDYFMLPPDLPDANLNTGVFDKDGIYWFTGQNGVHGYVNPKTGKHESWKSPRRGTYGITVTPTNEVWYVALAGDHLGKIDKATGNVDDRRAA